MTYQSVSVNGVRYVPAPEEPVAEIDCWLIVRPNNRGIDVHEVRQRLENLPGFEQFRLRRDSTGTWTVSAVR